MLSLVVYSEFSTVDNKFSHKGLRRYLYHIIIIAILSGLIKKIAFSELVIKYNFLADNASALLFSGCFLICFYQNFFLKEKNKLFPFLFFVVVFICNSLTALVTIVVCIFYLYLSRFGEKKKKFIFNYYVNYISFLFFYQ